MMRSLSTVLSAMGISACILAAAARARAADAVTLVETGKSGYFIVVAENASDSEKWAAQELQAHLQAMSGAKLSLVDKAPPVPGRCIFVGAGASPLRDVDWKALGEGCILQVQANGIVVIAGGRREGTMDGVFTLLDKLGCRWWTFTESTIPRSPTILLPVMDLRIRPRLEYRDMMYGEMWGSDKSPWFTWAARNHINGMGWEANVPAKFGKYPYERLNRSFLDVLSRAGVKPPAEALALVDGNRSAANLCLSSGAALAAVTEAVRTLLARDADQAFLAVGPLPGRVPACQCETCKALAEKEGPSGAALAFVNRVAEAIEKDYPRVRLLTHPVTQRPPASLQARANVLVRLGDDRCDFARPIAESNDPATVEFRKDLDGWNRAAPGRIFLWDHVANQTHYLMPHPNLDVLVPNLRYFTGHGVTGLFSQGSHATAGAEFSILRRWVTARAMGDEQADGNSLISEFLAGYYGPAAPAIRRYIDVLHKPVRESSFALRKEMPFGGEPYLAPEVIAEAESCLRDAQKAAAGDADLTRRVRHAHMPVLYVLARRGAGSATWKATEARAGKLDSVQIAADLAKSAEEYHINRDADGPHYSKGWIDWIGDYAARVAKDGLPVPPQLKGVDPGSYRLLQAGQLDSYYPREPWLVKSEGSTSGWALACPETKWHIQYYFSRYDDMKPGKSYKLFVRVQGGPKTGDGTAFSFGIHSDSAGFVKFRDVATGELSADEFRVFELDGVALPPDSFAMFGFYLGRDRPMAKVYLDCIWLVESPAQKKND